MQHILKIIGIILAIILIWLAVWMGLMRDDVARVKASLAFHNEQQRTSKPFLNVKYDAVYATGFPFRFAVAVERATLSMVDGAESYAVSIPRATLTPTDATQGRYRVNIPAMIEAMYAKSGSTPEHYYVTVTPMPTVMVRAMDAKIQCGPMTGKACADVAADAPMISYAVGVPKSITLHMELNGQTRDESFALSPMEINVPIFQEIPKDLSHPLEIFVRVLREALVFKTPSSTAQ